MFSQVWYKNIIFSFIISVTIASYLDFDKLASIDSNSVRTYTKALISSNIDKIFHKKTPSKISAHYRYGIYSKNIPNKQILNHPFFKKKFRYALDVLQNIFYDFLYIFLSFYFTLVAIWYLFGRLTNAVNIVDGIKVLKASKVNNILKKESMKSNLHIGELHLVKNSETSHILLTGTTGTGKSTAIKQLLSQIRNARQKSVIIDYNGQFSNEFYQEGDFIIGTEDYYWDLLEDVKDPHTLSNLAHAIFDGKGSNYDEMWNNASKNFFIDCVNIILKEENPNIQDLYNILAKTPLKKIHKMLQGYSSHSMLDPSNEKTALSIRTNTIAYLDWLKQVRPSLNKISLVNWIKSTDYSNSCIFLKSTPKERTSLRNLHSIILDLLINEIMELGESFDRRIWMVIDELPALKKIPSLETALAEFRKYGGCVISSVQSLHQLFDIYGSSKAYTMIDQFNTKFIFRSDEYNLTNYLCKGLGNIKYIEKNENYSYGSHEVRDGVNISSIEKSKSVITPQDISSLDNFECYSILPYSKTKLSKINIKS